jgi:uncharacterized repeat protein (TIGR03837 family)
MTWDIFCTVIDNFGDIGVTWRLARQLAAEHHVPVRLWVDDLASFQRIRPEIDPALDTQHLAGVEVRRWTDPLPDVEPGDVVIEALACDLPDEFIVRMAARRPSPVWLNLEYLTAESWANGVHGLPSPHPRLDLTQYFYMPGYTDKTGGLTRETGLLESRKAFQADGAAQTAFWDTLGLPPRQPEESRLSLFAYENAAIPSLLSVLARSERPTRLLVPEGKPLPAISAWLGRRELHVGEVHAHRHLTIHALPMLDQDTYDRLLWACDVNFVRGEDSFLRAQYAARPLIWQAYRQEDRAHFAKLDAFLDLYCIDMPADLADATRRLWHAWNEESGVGTLWPAYAAHLAGLNAHARYWCDKLAAQPDLASKLMIFCEKIREKS